MTGSATGTPALILGVPRRPVAIAFTAYVGVVVLAYALRNMPAERGVIVSLAFALFTSGALYFNLRRAADYDAGRLAWRLVSVAAVVAIGFELALAAESAFPDRIKIPPVAWLAQSVASNGTLSLGLLLLPFGAQTVPHRIRMACDALAFFLAAFLVFWVIGARQEVADSTVPVLTRIEAVVSFCFNALELGIVIYIGSRAMQRFRGPLGWFLVAFTAMTIGTMVIMFARVRGEGTVGSFGELIQLIAFPCYLLAPMARRPAQLKWVDEASLAGDLLTYGPVALAMLVVLPASFASGSSDVVLAAGVPLLACTLIFRQFLSVRDVRELSRTLESRVAERSEALRRSEQALVQAQRLEAVGRVAGGVAHDFNNVLHAIQLAASSMEDSPELAEFRDEFEIIRTATRSGASLAREVLEFSKPDLPTGDQADVTETLSALEWMRHQLQQRQIRYDVQTPPQRLQVRLAAARLEQVMSNLIANARDAVADGGSIRVTAEHAWIADGAAASQLGIASGSYVRLTVADDGAGIPADVLPRVFEPYFTTKTDSQGTGLGLATCYNVVRRAGGTVTVSSSPGAGARFDVLLPSWA